MKSSRSLLEKTADLAEKYERLSKMVSAPEIIADNRYWRKVLAEKQALEPIVSCRNELVRARDEYEKCLADLAKEKEEEVKNLLSEEILHLSQKTEELCKTINRLLAERGGEDEALLELIPGGNKAENFCRSLKDCFRNYALGLGLTFSVKKEKPLTLYFSGAGANAYMHEENGVHKLVSDKETVTVTVTALPVQEEEKTVLQEKELRIDLFHSGGAGGQNINKVETAIRITHLATGIVVTCQDERSQLQNKRKAMETLAAKVDALKKQEKEKMYLSLRQKAAESVVCTYYPSTNVVTKGEDKYNYTEYMQGKRRKL